MSSSRRSPSPTRHRPLAIDGSALTIKDIVDVARHDRAVQLADTPEIRQDFAKSVACIDRALKKKKVVYGVNTGFGAMSGVAVTDREQMKALQTNLLWFLKAGAGNQLPICDVRAGMLLRLNCFVRHRASGIRWTILEHFEKFLNAGATPVVREFGSIGASGDLVPLSSIAGAVIGLDDQFKVEMNGERHGCRAVLE